MHGCEGTIWSEKHDGKDIHGAAGGEYDLEPGESAVSCTPSPQSQNNPSKHLQTIVVSCWF